MRRLNLAAHPPQPLPSKTPPPGSEGRLATPRPLRDSCHQSRPPSRLLHVHEDIDTARLKPALRHRTRHNPRVCAQPGCPQLTTTGSYCTTHTQTIDRARGTTSQRGYGTQHQHTRNHLAAIVNAGNATCSRCNQPIHPGQLWDLDHTPDRTGYLGPSHARCNRAAA